MVNTKGKVRVFVYGSLKTGQCNHVVLEKSNAVRVCRDSVSGHFDMIDFGPYPALRDREFKVGEDESTIYGEVYVGDEEMLAACDMLEGHPHFFRRRKVWCNHEKERVWVYVMNDLWEAENEQEVQNNCWMPSEAEQKVWKARGVTV